MPNRYREHGDPVLRDFVKPNALMADELEQWAAERAAQRCEDCRYFSPIGGTRGDGRCLHGKMRAYTRGCDRCDAFVRKPRYEPVSEETRAALQPRWILEAR